jgi:hypothetical protein
MHGARGRCANKKITTDDRGATAHLFEPHSRRYAACSLAIGCLGTSLQRHWSLGPGNPGSSGRCSHGTHPPIDRHKLDVDDHPFR